MGLQLTTPFNDGWLRGVAHSGGFYFLGVSAGAEHLSSGDLGCLFFQVRGGSVLPSICCFFFAPFISPSPVHSCFGGWLCASRAAAMLILLFPSGDPGCGLSGSLSIPMLLGHGEVFCTRGFSCCTFQTATLGPWGLC